MDAHGGTLVGRRGPGQFLDSLAVDSGGYICVASPGGGAILVFPPEGGTPEVIEMPAFLTTNICFGGPDLKTAYITLGSSGRIVSMPRSEEHTSELQSLMRISYAVFCLNKQKQQHHNELR